MVPVGSAAIPRETTNKVEIDTRASRQNGNLRRQVRLPRMAHLLEGWMIIA
jgi:hypothetical protein